MGALVNDEEHVALIEAAREGQPEPEDTGPPMSEWTAEVDMLAKVYDRLGELIMVTVAASGPKTKPKPPKPTSRPRTAFAKVRADRREKKHEHVKSRVQQARDEARARSGLPPSVE